LNTPDSFRRHTGTRQSRSGPGYARTRKARRSLRDVSDRTMVPMYCSIASSSRAAIGMYSEGGKCPASSFARASNTLRGIATMSQLSDGDAGACELPTLRSVRLNGSGNRVVCRSLAVGESWVASVLLACSIRRRVPTLANLQTREEFCPLLRVL